MPISEACALLVLLHHVSTMFGMVAILARVARTGRNDTTQHRGCEQQQNVLFPVHLQKLMKICIPVNGSWQISQVKQLSFA
jgi:hypothetical protein